MTPKARVLFLIPSLVAHGAERQLCELMRAIDPARFEVHLAVFYDPDQVQGDDLTPEVRRMPHVTLHSLHKRRGPLGNLLLLPRLLKLVLRLRPAILHGYMDGNLPALIVGRVTRARVVWGIRRSNGDPSGADARSLAMQRWMIRLSRFPHLIIFNSEAGLETHRDLGFQAPRMTVIPNGFDTARFAPDPALGQTQRSAWGIPTGIPLIGIVGRLYPVKGHATFLQAAAHLTQSHPEARFVCIGDGSTSHTQAMKQLARELGLEGKVFWPGATDQMPAAYNALSLLALASLEEGFPNVLGEAMACGIPCVATRVGDAEVLIGPTGRIVPVGDERALASALGELLDEPAQAREARGHACRERVVRSYGTDVLARRTEQALEDLLTRSTHVPFAAERS